MTLRRDALAAAAEWIGAVERTALDTAGWSRRSGRSRSQPDAANVIPGTARASLDVRHAWIDAPSGRCELTDAARTRSPAAANPELACEHGSISRRCRWMRD